LQFRFAFNLTLRHNRVLVDDKDIMNTIDALGFDGGTEDARLDLLEGWVPDGITLEGIVAQLRSNLGATDEYIAGYLSVIYQ
jgi:hypothetical protein